MHGKQNMMVDSYGGQGNYSDLAPLGSKFSRFGDELELQRYVQDVSNQNIPIGGTSLKYALGGAAGYAAGENDLANKGYDAIQNSYGKTLDAGLDNVINYFSPETGGVLSGPTGKAAMQMGESMAADDYMNATQSVVDTSSSALPYNSDMPGTMMVRDNYVAKRNPLFVPYQETDTGRYDQMTAKENYIRMQNERKDEENAQVAKKNRSPLSGVPDHFYL